ncbi:hypothetical protein LZ30DRAFT_19178 [Colletotrichum cereale]|nr:hypothetical protein LZ30DRAFT_19178 [Colletotrichum cereale]
MAPSPPTQRRNMCRNCLQDALDDTLDRNKSVFFAEGNETDVPFRRFLFLGFGRLTPTPGRTLESTAPMPCCASTTSLVTCSSHPPKRPELHPAVQSRGWLTGDSKWTRTCISSDLCPTWTCQNRGLSLYGPLLQTQTNLPRPASIPELDTHVLCICRRWLPRHAPWSSMLLLDPPFGLHGLIHHVAGVKAVSHMCLPRWLPSLAADAIVYTAQYLFQQSSSSMTLPSSYPVPHTPYTSPHLLFFFPRPRPRIVSSVLPTHPSQTPLPLLVGLPAQIITLHCGVPSWRMIFFEAARELPSRSL